MALLKKCVAPYIKDKSVQLNKIPGLFCKAGFEKDSSVYNEIQKIIEENNINIEDILTTRNLDLIKMFKLEQEDDQNKIKLIRTVLRKVDIEKMEKLDISQIETFTWQQICQVFEEHVGMSDTEQSEKWYTYFEEEGINGLYLRNMKVKTELGPFAQALNLNIGQRGALSKLLTEIQPKQEDKGSRSVANIHGTVGFIATGDDTKAEHIYVNSDKQKDEDKKVVKDK